MKFCNLGYLTKIDDDEVRIAIKVVDSFQLVDVRARLIVGFLLLLIYLITLKWVKMPLEEEDRLQELYQVMRAKIA